MQRIGRFSDIQKLPQVNIFFEEALYRTLYFGTNTTLGLTYDDDDDTTTGTHCMSAYF